MLKVYGEKKEIRKGWEVFFADNRMEARDICLFEWVERSIRGVTMTVHLIRRSEIDCI